MEKSKEAKVNVLLPIEHMEREYLTKCLLAQELVKRNFRVFIGPTEVLDYLIQNLGPSIYFHKSTHPRAKEYIEGGHIFCFLDEESSVATPRSLLDEFCRFRYKEANESNTSLIFLPGTNHLQSVRKLANVRSIPVEVCGWLRADLWREELSSVHRPEMELIRQEHGDYYLFVSSFGGGNEEAIQRHISSAPSEGFRATQSHKLRAFKEYISMLDVLARELMKSDELLIVRPHPSESIADWTRTLGHLENVRIIRGGDAAPWIMGAKAIIQFGSTVVTQAALYGKLSVQYRVERQTGITDTPSFELPLDADTPEQLYEMISSPSRHIVSQKELTRKLLSEVMAFEGRFVAERIGDTFERLDLPPTEMSGIKWLPLVKLRAFSSAFWRGSQLKTKLKSLGFFRNQTKTVFENIPGGISAKETQSLISRMANARGEEHQAEARQLAANLVEIAR